MSDNKKTELIQLMQRMGDSDLSVSTAAQHEFAKAVQVPLREVILSGDIVGNIYEAEVLGPGASTMMPLDLISPGDMANHVAYTSPGIGRIADRFVEADYVMVPTFDIANSIDFALWLVREARYNVVGRALDILNAGFIQKINDTGWFTILSAVADRNVLTYDADANAGQFSKRLISLSKVLVRRNGGGNSTSINRGRLTDIFVSPEGVEDVRNWGVEELDEVTRREIYLGAGEEKEVSLFGVNLVALDELGEGQAYQNFFTNDLGASIQGSDVELAVGLDLGNRANFHMPIKQQVEVFEDPTYHRRNMMSFYGRGNMGWAVLDNRNVIGLSY